MNVVAGTAKAVPVGPRTVLLLIVWPLSVISPSCDLRTAVVVDGMTPSQRSDSTERL